MRLFIAINFDEETRQKFVAVQQKLEEVGKGNFIRPENLHLTLVFLGEVSTTRVERVRKAMDRISFSPLELVFDHVGQFKRRGGDIWWIGLEANKDLIFLQRDLVQQLEREGFLLNKGRFTPHITLARKVVPIDSFEAGELLKDSIRTTICTVSLMLSERIAGKLVYTEQYAISAKRLES